MIVVDGSALLAILQGEPEASDCAAVLESGQPLLISAGSLAEALIVAGQRGIGADLSALVLRGRIEVVPVTAATATRMVRAYGRWGKGNHPAGLNLGDCFAYALASELDAPLLFVRDDFSRTDLRPALAPG